MNGYIQAQIQTGNSENEFGETIAGSISWGEKTECNYHANTLNNKGRVEGGKFSQSAYIITVHDMDFKASLIRLLDSNERIVCEKEVQSLEELQNVQRVKITI